MSVEDQLVVAADLIDIEEVAAVLHRLLPDHLTAEVGLPDGERTCGDVDEQARVLRRELADRVAIVQPFRPEILVVPDILADGDPHSRVVHDERLDVVGRFEVAILVEHVVAGEERFVAPADHTTVLTQGGGVEEAFPLA